MNAELERAKSAALEAGRILRTFARDAQVQSLDGRDIKTRADVEAEACVVRHLQPSGIAILAEESAAASNTTATGARWLVDPLDGTMNFSRGFPLYAVSIALWNGMIPELGAVLDLEREHLYSGSRDEGARRGDEAIHVSTVDNVSQAVLATGFPTGRDFSGASLNASLQRIQAFKKVRMIGSAALSLAFVASGVFDVYCEEDIYLWDVAAGIALVLAAGGAVWMTPPDERQKLTVFASNGRLAPADGMGYEGLEKHQYA